MQVGRYAHACSLRPLTPVSDATGTLNEVHSVDAGSAVRSVAFSPDGTKIVSAAGPTIKVWDAGRPLRPSLLPGLPFLLPLTPISDATGTLNEVQSVDAGSSVWSVALSPDGAKIVSGLVDGTIKVWDAATLDQIGDTFGVTRERIRQIESKTMAKLRHPSRSQSLRDYLE